jgi:hypothetical protein
VPPAPTNRPPLAPKPSASPRARRAEPLLPRLWPRCDTACRRVVRRRHRSRRACFINGGAAQKKPRAPQPREDNNHSVINQRVYASLTQRISPRRRPRSPDRGLQRALPIALCIVCVLAASESGAQRPNIFQQSQSAWKRMDACRAQARQQFPDYTAAAKAQRDRATKLCLGSQNLPPVAPETPNPTQKQ